jgi:hypothetical protein
MAVSTSHTYQEMDVNERRAYLEEETSYDDWGTTLITIGVILLLYDLLLFLFIGRDIRDGANFFVKWGIIQTAAGLLLVGAGIFLNRRAHTKDDA